MNMKQFFPLDRFRRLGMVLLLSATARAAPGDLDGGFGAGGKVIEANGTQGGDWRSVEVQPDGKILAAGVRAYTNSSLWLARYLPDGTPDPAFGDGGKAEVPFAFGGDIAVASDGKILVAGAFYTSFGMLFGVARFLPDGVLDAGFGDHGVVRTNVGGERSEAYSVAVQADGKIVLAGVSHISFLEKRMAVARYLPDGRLDASFGDGGKSMPYVGIYSDEARDVRIQGDGKIVVGGWCEDAFLFSYFAVLRLLADGTPDLGFGTGGRVVTEFASNADNQCHGMELQPDGKILLAGFTSERGTDFALLRYRADGTLDTSFGNSGRALTDFDNGSSESAYALALQGDGKMVLAGTARGGGTNVFAVIRHQPDGSLDPTFGSGGKVLTPLATGPTFGAYAAAVAVQPDGKLVAAGAAHDGTTMQAAIVRYSGTTEPEIAVEQPAGNPLADAAANVDFGSVAVSGGGANRTFTIRNASTANLTGLRVACDGVHGQDFSVSQPATSILGPGASTTFSVAFAPTSPGLRKAALHITSNDSDENPFDLTISGTGFGTSRDGALDPAFGLKGRTVTTVAGSNSHAAGIALRADGKMLVAGGAHNGANYDFALARYHADGNLDSTFGSQGLALTPFGTGHDFASSLAIQHDGRIVVAGRANNGTNDDFALSRHEAGGALDSSFGVGGKMIVGFGATSGELATGVALQSDGKIVVAGYCDKGTVQKDFALARLLPGGSPDTSFGTGGKVTTAIGSADDRAFGVVVQKDGKIVVAGDSRKDGSSDFAVARYLDDGTLDSSFGSGGKAVTPVGSYDDVARGVALQSDGKIVVAGTCSGSGIESADIALVRYLANGTPDPAFGSAGKVITDLGGGSDDSASALTVQGDGKILVAGSSNCNGSYDFVLLRYRADGTPDATFGNGGKMVLPVGGGDDFGWALALQPDGMVVVAGDTRNGADNDFALVRVMGTLEPAITVEQPAGSYLTDGMSSIDFGGLALDGGPGHRTFTVSNHSTTSLGPLSLSCDGPNAGDFSLGALSDTWLNPGESATFVVALLPTSAGVRTATLHITSNDPDESPFDVTLTGTGLVPPEILSPSPLPQGMVGAAYDFTFTAGSGTPPYTWTVSSGSPPPGLVLDGSGLLGGMPGQATVTPPPSFEVRVTDAYGFSARKTFLLAVIPHVDPGDLDPSFGTGGKVTTPLGSGETFAGGAVVQPDGRIVVAGYATVGGYEDFAVARYLPDGTPDGTFGTGGAVTTAVGTTRDYGRSIALQSDGKILVTGECWTGGAYDIGVVRYLPNGSLDSSFGTGGKVIVSVASSNDFPKTVLAQGDGKIVVAGRANVDFGLVRMLGSGALDNSFGSGGKVVTDFASGSFDYAEAAALQGDGKIVMVGYGPGTGGTDFALARYQTDGTLDPTFGTGGKLTTAVGSGTTGDYPYAVGVQTDGRIVVAGDSSHEFALTRYLANGTLDNSFGTSGKTIVSIGAHEDIAKGLAVQPDGRIAVAGYASNGQNNDFAVARFLPGGGLDTTFGSGGKATTPVGADDDHGRCVVLTADGGILVAGDYHNGPGSGFALVKYAGTPQPEIAVEQPAGSGLVDGAGVNFGAATPGGPAVVRSFFIRNAGTAALTEIVVTVDGPNRDEFSVGPFPVTSLAPGASVGFEVAFVPAGAGARTATVRVASNDADEDPFDIVVNGSGGGPLPAWRLLHFGSAGDSGDGANANDFDHDGHENLLEYALGGNPKVWDAAAVRPVAAFDGSRPSISFRCNAACSDIIYTVQVSPTLAPGSWVDIAGSKGGGPVQPVGTLAEAHDTGNGLRIATVVAAPGVLPAGRGFIRLMISE